MTARRAGLAAVVLLVVLAGCGSASNSGSSSSATESSYVGPAPITCRVFPANNPLNQPVTGRAVNTLSSTYINSVIDDGHLSFYFGRPAAVGIPYTVVGPQQARVPIHFTAYPTQSDPGPYPIPLDAPIEQNSDHHVLVLQNGTCKLYELWDAHRVAGGWDAGSGAVFNLDSDALRPSGWTSADAAGLPILPLLVRYDEVASGHIDHALRVTVSATQDGFIHPATHWSDNSSNPALPPMGLRFRLKADFSLAPYSGQALVILEALKEYGMVVADDGPSWYISGAPDPRWNEANLQELKTVPATAFEAVQSGSIHH